MNKMTRILDKQTIENNQIAENDKVYICAKYAGDIDENTRKAIAHGKYAYEQGYTPIIPHLLFPFLDDNIEEYRKDALNMCIKVLGGCAEMWIFEENGISDGMSKELEYALANNIIVKFFGGKK